jgi:hypothetical protein
MFAARNYSGAGSALDWRLIGPAYWSAFENSMNSTIATATVSDSATAITAAGGSVFVNGCVSFPDNSGNLKVYMIPFWFEGFPAINGYIYDPSTNSFSIDEAFGFQYTYNIRFSGGVLLKNRSIFLIPYYGGNTNIYVPRSYPSQIIGGAPNYLRGGVLMTSGNVYCYPDGASSNTASIFNTVNNTYSSAGGTINFSINNAILLKDGRIFLSGSSCRIYDPVSNTIVTPNVSGGGRSLLLQDGRVFIFNGVSIKIYYPNLDISIISSATPISGLNGSILLPDGKIFLVPNSATSAQIYDANLDALTTSSVVFPSGSNKYPIYTSLPNGKVLLTDDSLSSRSRAYGGNTGFNKNVLLSSYYNASPK